MALNWTSKEGKKKEQKATSHFALFSTKTLLTLSVAVQLNVIQLTDFFFFFSNFRSAHQFKQTHLLPLTIMLDDETMW